MAEEKSNRLHQNTKDLIADMGPCPEGLTLERIDNNGPYSPTNCRWTTQRQQCQNQRKTVRIMHDGRTLSLRGWAREKGIAYSTLRKRYEKGLPLFAAVQLGYSRRKADK